VHSSIDLSSLINSPPCYRKYDHLTPHTLHCPWQCQPTLKLHYHTPPRRAWLHRPDMCGSRNFENASVNDCVHSSMLAILDPLSRVPASEVLQNPRLFKTFSFSNSRPIQCPSSSQSFYSIQPYWYSRKKDGPI